MNIEAIQESLRECNLDGWLFFDHHRRDPLAYRVLHLPDDVNPSRRWYYFVPANGEARKLVHRIESHVLDGLPGGASMYSSWSEQETNIKAMLTGCRRIAMQYSPNCAIPYVSMVDAGTIELIRAAGVNIESSADLIQLFEARWTEDQFQMHVEAGKRVDTARGDAFRFIAEHLRRGAPVSEFDVQQFIRKRFSELGLTTDHGPIVAMNANASDPHYEPARDKTSSIGSGDAVLIDMWAKLAKPDAVYYDITWTGFCGAAIPGEIQKVFDVVTGARKSASDFVISKTADRERLAGYQVDDVARDYIRTQGFADYFFHRTGHSIGTEVHGTGANMDNFESHDVRQIIPNTCFSIEPGVYLPKFGIRSEVNVYVGQDRAMVTGEEQRELVRIE